MGRKTAIVTVLGVFAVCLGGVAAQGNAKPGMAMPKPAPELSQLKFFAGTFHCKGQAFESPFGPAHPTEATVNVVLELDGFWYTGRYAESHTKENPHPFEIDFVWGHDAAAAKFTAACHDNMGGSWNETSSGWSSDTMVFTGDSVSMGKKSGVRDTFTKKGADQVVHRGEMEVNGQWMKLGEETCTRVAMKQK